MYITYLTINNILINLEKMKVVISDMVGGAAKVLNAYLIHMIYKDSTTN